MSPNMIFLKRLFVICICGKLINWVGQITLKTATSFLSSTTYYVNFHVQLCRFLKVITENNPLHYWKQNCQE